MKFSIYNFQFTNKFQITKFKKEQGQTILELLVVLLVLGLVIVGVVSVVTVSVRNARFSKDQAQASRYAQEAMEWVRQQRDTSWALIPKVNRTYCMSALTWSISTPCTSNSYIQGTSFIRNTSITVVDDTTVTVETIVSWTDSQGTHKSDLSTHLTNWR